MQMYALFPNKPTQEQFFSHKKFVFFHLLTSYKVKCDGKGDLSPIYYIKNPTYLIVWCVDYNCYSQRSPHVPRFWLAKSGVHQLLHLDFYNLNRGCCVWLTCRNDPLWVRSVGYCGGQWHVTCPLR